MVPVPRREAIEVSARGKDKKTITTSHLVCEAKMKEAKQQNEWAKVGNMSWLAPNKRIDVY